MILEKQSRGGTLDAVLPEATLMKDSFQENQHYAAEVTKLKEMLTQRDNEISIL